MSALNTLNNIFYQDYLHISTLDHTIILLLMYKQGTRFTSVNQIHRIYYLLANDFMYYYYLVFLIKSRYSVVSYHLILNCMNQLTNNIQPLG